MTPAPAGRTGGGRDETSDMFWNTCALRTGRRPECAIRCAREAAGRLREIWRGGFQGVRVVESGRARHSLALHNELSGFVRLAVPDCLVVDCLDWECSADCDRPGRRCLSRPAESHPSVRPDLASAERLALAD